MRVPSPIPMPTYLEETPSGRECGGYWFLVKKRAIPSPYIQAIKGIDLGT